MADEVVVETPERPEWLEDKFKTPEDQAQAYAAAQAEMHRLRQQGEQERQQFQAALESMQTQQQTQQVPVIQSQGFDPGAAELEQAYERGDYSAIMRIQAEAAARATVPAVAQLIDQKLGEMTPTIEAQQAHVRESSIRMAEQLVAQQLTPEKYKELLPGIQAQIADNPNFLPQSASVEGYATAILNVAKLAEHDTLAQQVEALTKERNEKLAANQLSPGGNRSIYTQDEQQAYIDRIKNTPVGSFNEVLRGT